MLYCWNQMMLPVLLAAIHLGFCGLMTNASSTHCLNCPKIKKNFKPFPNKLTWYVVTPKKYRPCIASSSCNLRKNNDAFYSDIFCAAQLMFCLSSPYTMHMTCSWWWRTVLKELVLCCGLDNTNVWKKDDTCEVG